MSAVIEKDPPPLPDSVPPPLKSIVERCLAKDPGRRFQSASDLAFALRALSGSAISVKPVERSVRRRFVWAALAAAVGLILLVAIRALRPWQPDLAAYRFVPFATEEYPEYGAAWAPNGLSIAYCAIANNEYRLLVKSVEGGIPTVIVRHPYGPAGRGQLGSVTWAADSSRLFYVFRGQVWSVARTGGTPERLDLGDVNSFVVSLAASPDGSGLTFDHGAMNSNAIGHSLWFAAPRATKPSRIPYRDESPLVNLTWSPDSSHLLGTKEADSGDQLVLLDRNGVARNLLEGEFQRTLYTAWLPGSRYALVSTSPGDQGIRLIDTASGRTEIVLPMATPVGAISVSPDGSKIACAMGIARASIMEIGLDGSAPRPFLGSRVNDGELAWSPDGTEFAYVYDEEIRIRNRAGTAERTVVSRRDFPGYRGTLRFEKPSFSPDGQRLLYTLFGIPGRPQGIWISPVDGGTPAVVEQAAGYAPLWTMNGAAVLFNPPGGGIRRYRLGSHEPSEQIFPKSCDPAASPDGKWIVCPATPDGLTLVSLDSKATRVLSNERMITAAFSPDSASIYAVRFSADPQELVKIDIATGRIQTSSTLPREFDIRGPQGGPTRLTVSPDGKTLFTTIRRNEGDIWILEGFNPPRSLRERLWARK